MSSRAFFSFCLLLGFFLVLDDYDVMSACRVFEHLVKA